MLMPPSTPIVPEVASRMEAEDEPMTEGYGEPSQNARNMSGNVDFFSSLGTERKKKPQPDRPDPEKVRPHIAYYAVMTDLVLPASHQPQGTEHRTQGGKEYRRHSCCHAESEHSRRTWIAMAHDEASARVRTSRGGGQGSRGGGTRSL